MNINFNQNQNLTPEYPRTNIGDIENQSANIQNLSYLSYNSDYNPIKQPEYINQTLSFTEDLSKNSLLFAKSNRIIIIQDEASKKKETESIKMHGEHPWALKDFKDEKNEKITFPNKEIKTTQTYLDNKGVSPSGNYRRNDDFIEFKPKRYLKCLENEKPDNYEVPFPDDDKLNIPSNPSILKI